MNCDNATVLKRNRLMFIIEAALEYAITILVSGSFLATLTKEIGMSDSLTGILSAVISLGCLFQLLSIFYRGRRKKNFVIVLSIINQLLFMSLYVIPLAGGEKPIKIVAFVIAIFTAYILFQFAHPKKVEWLMSSVDDHCRGRFTANKERVSLVVEMVFSYIMGAMIDHFAEREQKKVAFVLAAIVILLLMILHTTTLIMVKEKEAEPRKKECFLE